MKKIIVSLLFVVLFNTSIFSANVKLYYVYMPLSKTEGRMVAIFVNKADATKFAGSKYKILVMDGTLGKLKIPPK